MKIVKEGTLYFDGCMRMRGWVVDTEDGPMPTNHEFAREVLLHIAKTCHIENFSVEPFDLNVERAALDAIAVARWKEGE